MMGGSDGGGDFLQIPVLLCWVTERFQGKNRFKQLTIYYTSRT